MTLADDALFGGLFAVDPEPVAKVSTPAPRPLSVIEELKQRPMPIRHGEIVNTYLGPLPCQWSRTEPNGSIFASIRITGTEFLVGTVQADGDQWRHVHHVVSPASSPKPTKTPATVEQQWISGQIERFLAADHDRVDPLSDATLARDQAWLALARARVDGTDDGRSVSPQLAALASTQHALFVAGGRSYR